MAKQNWQQTSVYLNAETSQIVTELQKETKLGRSALIRLAIERMYYGEDREKQARLLAIAEEIKRLA